MLKKKSWNDVTIDEFTQIQDSYKDTEMTDEDRTLNLVYLLTDEDPMEMPFTEFQKVLKELQFIKSEVPANPLKKRYELNGKKYRLMQAIDKISTAQYIDYTTYLKNMEDDIDYVNILSVFILPEDSVKYNDGYDLETVKNDIRYYMSIADALGIFRFFFRYYKNFIDVSLYFLRKRLKKMKRKMQKGTEEYKKMEEIIRNLQTLSESPELS